jgi:ribose transport system permease protein
MPDTPSAVAVEEAPQKRLSLETLRPYLPFIGLAAILAFFAVTTGGQILTVRNLTLMLNNTYLLFIACIGVFMIMTMGSLDFSQGSMLGVASIVVCVLSNYNVFLAILGGILTGAAIGAVNAFFFVNRQIPSFIVTNCMMFLLRGVIQFFTNTPVMGATYLQQQLWSMPLMITITLVCLAVGYFVFTFTSLGAQLKAIGAGQTAARFAGVKVHKLQALVYIAAGAITGFAAFINCIKVGSVTSQSGMMLETQILIALVMGGMPISGGAKVRFTNIIVGVLSYRILNQGLVMMGFDTMMQQLIMGIVFLIVVALFSDRESISVIK